MRHGFSLVELSIVLVILGLLTGGILAGQSLIRASELRSVTTEMNQINSAVRTFQDKYRALPGDMPNAIKFWGAQAGSTTADGIDATCAALAVAATGTATCNGNGNGNIAVWSAVTDTQQIEMFRFWQHLANAGLIPGSYSGIVGAAGVNDNNAGVNCMATKISTGGWTSVYRAAGDDSATHFTSDSRNYLIVGGDTSQAMQGALFSPEEAWNIDTKVDDGKPAYGRARGVRWSTCTNAASSTDYAATYALTTTGAQCAMSFSGLY